MGILEVHRRGSSAEADLSEIECRQRRGAGYQSDEEELSSPRLWLRREGHQLELKWRGRLRWVGSRSQKLGQGCCLGIEGEAEPIKRSSISITRSQP
jgi:hypothetical protein